MTLFSQLRRAWSRFRARPAAERRQLLFGLARTVRTKGAAAALARIRRVAEGDDARYQRWCAVHTPSPEDLQRMRQQSVQLAYQPLVSILTPACNTDPGWLEACADSVMAQAYPHWEWHIVNDGSSRADTNAALERIATRDSRITVHRLTQNRGISGATNVALSAARGDYIALLDHDDALLPHALFRTVEAINQAEPRPEIVYSDEDKLGLDGRRCDAYFKPDWSPDLFLSSMYVCHFLVARRELVVAAGGFRSEYDFAQDYDLVLRLIERTNAIAHVPDVLYHWRKIPQSAAAAGDAKPTAHVAAQRALQDYLDRNGLAGWIEDAGPPGLHRVRYRLTGNPLVSVVVPASRPDDGLARTLAALEQKTGYRNIEVIVVGTRPLNAEIAARLQRFPGSFEQVPDAGSGFPAWMNRGAAIARGSQLLFLAEGAEPLHEGWLEAMLELSEQRHIGAVGAKLLDERGMLRHIGLVLGLGGLAASPFEGQHPDIYGYFSNAICIRNCSAVSGACVMTRREAFDRVQGFDETLSSYADIDYCLKLQAQGLRIVFTPYARLVVPAEQVSVSPGRETRAREVVKARWPTAFERDPYYNPNLSREFPDYRVEA
jgi:GT2 family glycosyltransferase